MTGSDYPIKIKYEDEFKPTIIFHPNQIKLGKKFKILEEFKGEKLLGQEYEHPFYEDLKDIKSYVDIGCGISYSTCALKQLFPNAKAYAINLRETKQWKFCEFMSEKYGYTLVDSIDSINEKVDLVFASEYFEHIENPTKHFDEIVTAIDPDWFVIANAFNTHSIGHYEKYYYNDQIIDQSKINLIFNKHIRESNFKDMNYSIWNNKPKIWKKTKDTNLMEFL
mgnify:CR=1 FL=1